MKIYHHTVRFSTNAQFQLIDVTRTVEEAVTKSGVLNGIVLIHAPHATAAIILNEHEEGLINDILDKLRDLTEPGSRRWRHNMIDDNAHAHIGSAIIGAERIIPVINGRIARGTWQNIFFVEMDGPRSNREVVITVIGE
ncbi:MAG: secondary thiamine-phosphate synthase enzyme YjbQ [Desulfurococcus sp.]|uniref:secondary thiamine-phosphate synthase enzyme YjbQ n=1 Tax=Desulfurococcus sp. TaxID=51678 RepID=UPI003D13695F